MSHLVKHSVTLHCDLRSVRDVFIPPARSITQDPRLSSASAVVPCRPQRTAEILISFRRLSPAPGADVDTDGADAHVCTVIAVGVFFLSFFILLSKGR